MKEHLVRAEHWLDRVVSDAVRTRRMAAIWHVLIALVACAIWLVMAYTCAIVARLFGWPFSPAWLAIGLVVLQFVIFPFVRRPKRDRWRVEAGLADGEIVATAPDNSAAQHYAYNQDHGFSFKRAYFAIYLAAPIALDEAVRDWREAKRLRRLDRARAARLAAMLVGEQRKVTFEELGQRWRGGGLIEALHTATDVPGLQMFGSEPQGIALTDSAIEDILAA